MIRRPLRRVFAALLTFLFLSATCFAGPPVDVPRSSLKRDLLLSGAAVYGSLAVTAFLPLLGPLAKLGYTGAVVAKMGIGGAYGGALGGVMHEAKTGKKITTRDMALMATSVAVATVAVLALPMLGSVALTGLVAGTIGVVGGTAIFRGIESLLRKKRVGDDEPAAAAAEPGPTAPPVDAPAASGEPAPTTGDCADDPASPGYGCLEVASGPAS